jgi:hypothetical protein
MVIEKAVDPDAAPLKPVKLVVIHQGPVVIEGAHEPTVLMIDSIAIPEREVGLKEFRLVALAEFRQAHAGQFKGSAGLAA